MTRKTSGAFIFTIAFQPRARGVLRRSMLPCCGPFPWRAASESSRLSWAALPSRLHSACRRHRGAVSRGAAALRRRAVGVAGGGCGAAGILSLLQCRLVALPGPRTRYSCCCAFETQSGCDVSRLHMLQGRRRAGSCAAGRFGGVSGSATQGSGAAVVEATFNGALVLSCTEPVGSTELGRQSQRQGVQNLCLQAGGVNAGAKAVEVFREVGVMVVTPRGTAARPLGALLCARRTASSMALPNEETAGALFLALPVRAGS